MKPSSSRPASSPALDAGLSTGRFANGCYNIQREGGAREVDSLMKRLRRVNAGRHFTRDEMNER